MENMIPVVIGVLVTLVTQLVKKTGIRGSYLALGLSVLAGIGWVTFTEFTDAAVQEQILAFITKVYGVSVGLYELVIRQLNPYPKYEK